MDIVGSAYTENSILTSHLFHSTDAVERAAGPLLVEIDKASGSALGLSVGSTLLRGKPVICIEHIEPASIADR